MIRRLLHQPAPDPGWAERLAQDLRADTGPPSREQNKRLVLAVAAGSRRARLVVEPPPEGEAVPTRPRTPCAAAGSADGSQVRTAESGAQNGPGHPRLPLVYADPVALDQARSLLPGVVLENIVTRKILEGSISYRRARGIALVRGAGWTATVRRCQSRSGTGRRAWRIIEVTARASRPTDAALAERNDKENGRKA